MVKAGIALCPENRRLFPNMTIEDNLVLGGYGNSHKVIAERLEQAYEKFAWIGKRRGELAGKLSGGEQQAVAIARSLMASPSCCWTSPPAACPRWRSTRSVPCWPPSRTAVLRSCSSSRT
ncbi:ATP-binding cassette domain-containing protein [Streptomyces bottropensis]|uniref:ATP-binding cassette domain-containing protein n=1 Tax=Streptomyces bottropensis TaxID=42235 RepID=UPI00369EA2D7